MEISLILRHVQFVKKHAPSPICIAILICTLEVNLTEKEYRKH